MLNFAILGRSGALTRIRITGSDEALEQIQPRISEITGTMSLMRGGAIETSCSRRDFRRVDELVSALNAAEARTANMVTAGSRPARVLVEVGTAQIGSLLGGRLVTDLGRSWCYTLTDHERMCVHPEWVGHRVRYAYFD